MPSHSRYLAGFFTLFGGATLLIVALNLIVAPFDPFGAASWARYRDGLTTRIAKGEALTRGAWEVLLLGNSRVETGLDPQHPALGSGAYNAAMSDTTFEQTDLAMRLALKDRALKRIIMGVDVSDFDPDRNTGSGDHLRSLLNPDFSRTEYWLSNTLSVNATQYSIGTLQNTSDKFVGFDWPRGRYEPRSSKNLEKNWNIRRQADVLDRWGQGRSAAIAWPQMRRLEKCLAEASRGGVEVTLVHMPLHALHYEQWVDTPEWGLTEQWLKAVVDIVARHNEQFPDHSIELWDFTEYGPYTTEEVPSAGPDFQMKWFWDPGHCKKELGDLVIDRISGLAGPGGRSRDDFGVLLTPQTVARHLERMREGRRKYLAEHPEMRPESGFVTNSAPAPVP